MTARGCSFRRSWRPARSLGRALAVALVVLGVAAPAGSGEAAARSHRCRGYRLLPHLASLVPDHIDVRQEGTPTAPRYLLAFQSTVANEGAGPLTLAGERTSPGRTELTVRQLIQCSAGPPASHARAGVMAYENEPPHSHWEVEGFERFELRARASGTEVRRSRKVGFCPADVYRVVMPAPVELAHLAPNPVFEAHIESECGTGNPAATRVMSGVSVGYADVYQAYLQGQYVDVTGLSAGTYRLINEANPARTILEERYDGDVAGIDVALAWPGGPERPPTIALGASCLGRAACGA